MPVIFFLPRIFLCKYWIGRGLLRRQGVLARGYTTRAVGASAELLSALQHSLAMGATTVLVE